MFSEFYDIYRWKVYDNSTKEGKGENEVYCCYT